MAYGEVKFNFEPGMKVTVIPQYSKSTSDSDFDVPIGQIFTVKSYMGESIAFEEKSDLAEFYYAYRFMPVGLSELEKVIYGI